MYNSRPMIFVSYSRKDSEFVDRLQADLQRHRLDPWVDRGNLEGGQDWVTKIQETIDSADAVLVILSPEALKSFWVRQEYLYAVSRRKPIIPVLANHIASKPFPLSNLESIDFDASYGAGILRLLQSLETLFRPSQLKREAQPHEWAAATSEMSRWHEELVQRLHLAMQQFTNAITSESHADPIAPAMSTVLAAIREVIFRGRAGHIEFAARQVLQDRTIWLEAVSPNRALPSVRYPDMLPAWALVQGDVITYPLDPNLLETLVDYAWLKRAGKLHMIDSQLAARSLRDPDPMRIAAIRKRLQDGVLTLGDLSEPPLPIGAGTTWVFVPVPFRLDGAGGVGLRERGVLYFEIDPQTSENGAKAFVSEYRGALQLVSGLLNLLMATNERLRSTDGI